MVLAEFVTKSCMKADIFLLATLLQVLIDL